MTARFGLALLGCVAFGCPPTLSRPHSDAHVAALAEGERHQRHGRYDEAAAAWARAAEEADRRVDRDEALYRRSRALRRAGRHAEAVADLDAIVATQPPSRRTARALLDASRIRIEHLDQRARGIADLERVVLEFPDEGPAGRALHTRLLYLQEEAGVDAVLGRIETFYDAVGATKLGDDLLSREATLRLEAGDRAGTRRALERIVSEHPYPQGHRWDDANVRLATMDVEDGQPRAAIERLERMLERSEGTMTPGSYTLPSFAAAQLQIARIHRDQLDDKDAASDAFEAVYDDFPNSLLRDDAITEMAEMWLAAGETRRACRAFERVVEEFEVGAARRRAHTHHIAHCTD